MGRIPPTVNRMAHNPALQPFATFLYHCLRYDPSERASVTRLRAQLRKLRPELEAMPWPLRVEA